MRVAIATEAPAAVGADALAIPVPAGGRLSDPAVLELDRHLEGLLTEVAGSDHRGRLHEILPLPTRGRIAARRILLYGLGNPDDLDGQRLRNAHHEMIRGARTYGYRRVAVLAGAGPLGPRSLPGVVEGCVLGTWERRSRQTGGPDRVPIAELLLCGVDPGRQAEVDAAAQAGAATNRARELTNLPANELSPEKLADEARLVGERHGMEVEILGPRELGSAGYGLLLGVASGSNRPPRLVRIQHRGPARSAAPSLALVGKGVTFDSGGISIKAAEGMDVMRGDMAGAAAVIAAMDVIGERRVPLDVMGVIAAADNMPGGGAQRPGDVIMSAAGRTVEIVDTDNEGRLLLADALTHALRSGATHLVDLATLTGAAVRALGHGGSIGLTNDDGLWEMARMASEDAGDRIWRLPLYPDYRVLLRSLIADLRNAGYGEAGAIMGGMFLQEFVEGRPWLHLDIAASAWNDNVELTTLPRGPLGSGTRLVVRLAELMAAQAR